MIDERYCINHFEEELLAKILRSDEIIYLIQSGTIHGNIEGLPAIEESTPVIELLLRSEILSLSEDSVLTRTDKTLPYYHACKDLNELSNHLLGMKNNPI